MSRQISAGQSRVRCTSSHRAAREETPRSLPAGVSHSHLGYYRLISPMAGGARLLYLLTSLLPSVENA